MEMLHNRRCRDWEAFDKIELVVVPRYKTSEMSGDEWRTGIAIKFWFKGYMVHETFFTGMRAALMMLSSVWLEASSPISDEVRKLEKEFCDQPGCSEKPVHRYLLKRLATNEGWLEKRGSSQYYRKFCDRHKMRGDCGLEDSDANYEKGPLPRPDEVS